MRRLEGSPDLLALTWQAANPSEKDMEQFTMEVRVLRNLHHRNIVQFYGACLEPGSLFFVTELMKVIHIPPCGATCRGGPIACF